MVWRFTMIDRRIKNAEGNLYDHDSRAGHWALEKLEGFLRGIGFVVVKKTARERTLRVYPTKIGQYPLLNPSFRSTAYVYRFWPAVVYSDYGYDTECLSFTVYSRGDRRALHAYLKTFAKTRGCAFYPHKKFNPAGKPKDLLSHGYFILPLRFKAKEIDFKALDEPLRALLPFLEGAPVGGPL
jgi:hypothetical protein